MKMMASRETTNDINSRLWVTLWSLTIHKIAIVGMKRLNYLRQKY